MNPAEYYIINQPEPYKTMLLHIQLIVEQTLADAELLFKWKIPFYYINGKPFCYLNVSNDYVDVGFWHSAHLTVHQEHMVTNNRQVVKSLRYKTVNGIDDTILIDVLRDAYNVRQKGFWK